MSLRPMKSLKELRNYTQNNTDNHHSKELRKHIDRCNDLSDDYMRTQTIKNFKSWGVDVEEPKKLTREYLEEKFPLMGKITDQIRKTQLMGITLNGEENYLRMLKLFYKEKYGVEVQ